MTKIDWNDPCVFCQIHSEEPSVLHESKYFFTRMDLFPITPGHCEIIPKDHKASMLELTLVEQLDFFSTLHTSLERLNDVHLKNYYTSLLAVAPNKKSEELLHQAIQSPYCDEKIIHWNGGINEGEYAGRSIHHMHFHIIPRYKGDVANPRGGVRNIFPKDADYMK